MRIAQVAPLVESVPPQLYGGTERVVHALTEELVRRGHDGTLFASGDSCTSARLAPCCSHALRLNHGLNDLVAHSVIELGMVYARAGEFDVIHNHIDWLTFPCARVARSPTITTTHGRLDLPDARRIYNSFPDLPLVSISKAQRTPLPRANWLGTVYNGIDLTNFTLRDRPGAYLAFLGRISSEKRPDRAVQIARQVGMPLRIAAKVDEADREYCESTIKPLLRDLLVEYIGEIGESEKDRFLGEAYAYLFPIDWPEPFGITMIEAIATGTPVIAMNRGSVPEVVLNGQTGFICQTVGEMVEAVQRVTRIDRRACREHVARRFTVSRMVDDYEVIYRKLVNGEEVAAGQGT